MGTKCCKTTDDIEYQQFDNVNVLQNTLPQLRATLDNLNGDLTNMQANNVKLKQENIPNVEIVRTLYEFSI